MMKGGFGLRAAAISLQSCDNVDPSRRQDPGPTSSSACHCNKGFAVYPFLFLCGDRVPARFVYSGSRRAFLRLRLRAKACLTRSFWPGFK
jgi:hypothetical protein